MATKKDVSVLLAAGGGVSVVQSGKDFKVGFSFASTLVEQMRQVPQAKFDEQENAWHVPAASVDQLIAAVQTMRAFNEQGGVLVRDVPAGKLVVFDFDRAMNRLIGPVDGAKFSKEDRGWVVPSTSKALESKGGQASYFDKVVNDMRGHVRDSRVAYQEILDGAVKEAMKLDCTPGIHHPKDDHSYTGKIVLANPYWAAQLTSINDEKGVAFITVHKQSDFGQEVFTNDELRIDYRPGGEIQVRTTEVFRQQKAEREHFAAVAGERMAGGSIFNAGKDGQYDGRVVEVGKHFALQHVGQGKFALHDLARLKGGLVADSNAEIKYKDGRGVVAERDVGRGVGR